MKKILLIALISISLISCTRNANKAEDHADQSTEVHAAKVDYAGSYATSDYQNRDKGYDWVGVTVVNLTDSTIQVSVRSRADIKKPTCTFDAEAHKISENVYRSVINGKAIQYSFKENKVTIGVQSEEGEGLLYYYCSGGASLGDTYTKIEGQLDDNQVDKNSRPL